MPLISAAMCPHPMALIPEVFGEGGDEWLRLRAACVKSVRRLGVPFVTARHQVPPNAAELVVIVGGDDTTRSFDPGRAYGSLLSNGVFWEYGWASEAQESQPLPLSLTLGDWLLSKSRPGDTGFVLADISFQAIDFYASPQECAELGHELSRRPERVAMLVMGEGSTSLTAEMRARDAEQAKLCDSVVSRALEHADVDALASLGPSEFPPATGRAAWQVLAGAAAGRRFQGQLHFDGAHSDLKYFVASWT